MRYLLPLLVLLTACGSAPESAKKAAEKAAEQPVFQVDAATAGTIRGTIRFAGKRPPVQIVSMDADAQCAKMYGGATMTDESVVVNSNGTFSNVFVYLKTGLEGKRFAAPTEPVTIDQKGCWFHPRVLGIQTGQTFQVTNSDTVTHNIHPQPDKNRDWNQSQSPEDLPLRRKFTAPEIMIPVKCNVHKWMRAWVGVVDHPYFAVTGADGSFTIRNVPPGNYTVAVWQEKLGTGEQPVTLATSGTSELTFTLKGN